MRQGIGVGRGQLREIAWIQRGFQDSRWDERQALMQGLG